MGGFLLGRFKILKSNSVNIFSVSARSTVSPAIGVDEEFGKPADRLVKFEPPFFAMRDADLATSRALAAPAPAATPRRRIRSERVGSREGLCVYEWGPFFVRRHGFHGLTPAGRRWLDNQDI